MTDSFFRVMEGLGTEAFGEVADGIRGGHGPGSNALNGVKPSEPVLRRSNTSKRVENDDDSGKAISMACSSCSFVASLTAQATEDPVRAVRTMMRPETPRQRGPLHPFHERRGGAGPRQSLDIQDAYLALEEADERVAEAWSSVMPKIDFSGSYTRNIAPMVSFLPAEFFGGEEGEYVKVQFGADNAWASTFVLDQPLFEAQAFIGVGAAARYKGLQEEVLRGRAQNLVTRVRLAYYGLLLAQEELRLITESVDRVQAVPGRDPGPEPGRHRLGLRRSPSGGGAGEPGAESPPGRERRDPGPQAAGHRAESGGRWRSFGSREAWPPWTWTAWRGTTRPIRRFLSLGRLDLALTSTHGGGPGVWPWRAGPT